MPDLSDTLSKCRIGTAKKFTLLLLLYHTQANTQLLQQILAAFCIAGTNRSFSDKSTVNILVIRCIKIIIYVIYEIGVNVFYLFVFI